ncbi:MAG: type II secretion system F family protein, partial [Vicinamibacteria bacterium]
MSLVMAVFVSIVAAAAIAFITYAIVSPLAAWWDRYLTKWSRWMQLELEAMHQELPRNRCRQILSYSVLVMSVLGFLVDFSVIFALIFGGLGLLVPRWGISWLRARRFRRINEQLGEALTMVSSSLRSGLSLPQGVELVVEEMDPPIAEEFAIVIKENRLGLAFDEALTNLAERVPTPDLDMVVTAIVTIRETGANLAEVFDVIAHTVRERKKVEGKIQAMTAEGMTQGMMMCAVPPILIIVFFFLDPTLVQPLFTTILGILMLMVIAAMDAMG